MKGAGEVSQILAVGRAAAGVMEQSRSRAVLDIRSQDDLH
jgi:hypothetical protein